MNETGRGAGGLLMFIGFEFRKQGPFEYGRTQRAPGVAELSERGRGGLGWRSEPGQSSRRVAAPLWFRILSPSPRLPVFLAAGWPASAGSVSGVLRVTSIATEQVRPARKNAAADAGFQGIKLTGAS